MATDLDPSQFRATHEAVFGPIPDVTPVDVDGLAQEPLEPLGRLVGGNPRSWFVGPVPQQVLVDGVIDLGGDPVAAKEAKADRLRQRDVLLHEAVLGFVGQGDHRRPERGARHPLGPAPNDTRHHRGFWVAQCFRVPQSRDLARANVICLHEAHLCITMPGMEDWRSGGGPSLLDQARREDGLTQQELARRLGVGQPHLSRLLRGRAEPSPRLFLKIRRYLRSKPRAPAPDWARQVVETAAASPDFLELVLAALKVAKHN